MTSSQDFSSESKTEMQDSASPFFSEISRGRKGLTLMTTLTLDTEQEWEADNFPSFPGVFKGPI